MELKYKFSEWLKMALDERNVTQKQLADKMFVSISTVNNMVNARHFTSIVMWSTAFEVLGVEVDFRLAEDKPLTGPY